MESVKGRETFNQDSFGALRKREKGIEPSLPAWKAGVLPLNYSRESFDNATHLEFWQTGSFQIGASVGHLELTVRHHSDFIILVLKMRYLILKSSLLLMKTPQVMKGLSSNLM